MDGTGLLKKSFRRLPGVMKYAIAVAAIVELVAVGMAQHRGAWGIAVGGFVVLLLFMVLLLVFESISQSHSRSLKCAGHVLIWASLVIPIGFVLGIVSLGSWVMTGWPQLAVLERLVSQHSSPNPPELPIALPKLKEQVSVNVPAGQERVVRTADMAVDEGAENQLAIVGIQTYPRNPEQGAKARAFGRHGTAEVAADGLSVTYRAIQHPDSGSDVFVCRLQSKGGPLSDDVKLMFHVLSSRNTPPTASDIKEHCWPGDAIEISLEKAVNDTDPERPMLKGVTPTKSGAGAEMIAGSNAILYTAALGYHGDDEFMYTVEDRLGEEATGTIRIRVPERRLDETRSITERTRAGVPVEVALLEEAVRNSYEVWHDQGTGKGPNSGIVSQVSGRMWSLRYTPNPGFVGQDQIRFLVRDRFSGRFVQKGTVVFHITSDDR